MSSFCCHLTYGVIIILGTVFINVIEPFLDGTYNSLKLMIFYTMKISKESL
jgi:hypothetical protein